MKASGRLRTTTFRFNDFPPLWIKFTLGPNYELERKPGGRLQGGGSKPAWEPRNASAELLMAVVTLFSRIINRPDARREYRA